jgi:hypothetical protein
VCLSSPISHLPIRIVIGRPGVFRFAVPTIVWFAVDTKFDFHLLLKHFPTGFAKVRIVPVADVVAVVRAGKCKSEKWWC